MLAYVDDGPEVDTVGVAAKGSGNMLKHPKLHILVLCVVLVSAFALVSSASRASYRVRASGEGWTPDFKRIVKGDKIVWANPTGTLHDVRSYRCNSRSWTKHTYLAPGEQTSKRFWSVGLYKYRYQIHSRYNPSTGNCQGMCGAIKVRRRS